MTYTGARLALYGEELPPVHQPLASDRFGWFLFLSSAALGQYDRSIDFGLKLKWVFYIIHRKLLARRGDQELARTHPPSQPDVPLPIHGLLQSHDKYA